MQGLQVDVGQWKTQAHLHVHTPMPTTLSNTLKMQINPVSYSVTLNLEIFMSGEICVTLGWIWSEVASRRVRVGE